VVTLERVHTASRDLSVVAFFFVGVALLLFTAGGPLIIRSFGYGVFVPLLAASGLLALAAARLAPAIPVRQGLVVIFAFGLLMRLLLAFEEPLLSTDIYRYVWDGRVQAAGFNPYAHMPADPALAALRDGAIFPHINRADYAVTIYPPVAQAFFLAVTRIAESLTAMRLALIGCEIVIVVLIIDLLRHLKAPVTAVVAYAWHPLAVWEIANNGHVDALMLALIMLGVWLLVRARPVAGMVAVALAALVKPYALIVSPAFWRPWDWRAPLAAVATIVFCYLPYLGVGRGALGWLPGYLSEEGLAEGAGFWLTSAIQSLTGPLPGLTFAYVAAAAVILGWIALRTVVREERTPEQAIAAITALTIAGLFFLSPNYAWYFLALVPFLALGAGPAAWTLTILAPLLYRPITLPLNELAWKSAVFVPFLVVLAVGAMRRRASPGAASWTT
jgi:alpha-1,6-mannosyltransferase